jgi:hypothetical protein
LETICKKEIIELHTFFEEWFNGALEKTRTNFKRVENVLDSNFTLITPSGLKKSRDELITLLWEAAGSRINTESPLDIWIENYLFEQVGTGLFLVTYEEWQKDEKRKRGRLSTAIFKKVTNDYNNLLWLHVHETWLPD